MNKYMKSRLKEETLRAELTEEQQRLAAVRSRIEELDQEILDSMEHRLELSRELYEVKKSLDMPVLDAGREARRIAALNGAKTLEEKELSSSKAAVLRALLRTSRRRQYRLARAADSEWALGKVLAEAVPALPAYRQIVSPGPALSLAAEAARTYFPTATVQPTPTFASALAAVSGGKAEAAVLPLENNGAGTIQSIFEDIRRSGLYIAASVSRPVHLHLVGTAGTTLGRIRKLIAERQSLDQNAKLIRNMGWRIEESGNAASAARLVAESGDESVAAIATEEAARLYGLDILVQEPQEDQAGRASYIVVAREPVITEDADTLSLVLKLPHQSGMLAEYMTSFADRDLNIISIRSLASESKSWESEVYVDVSCTKGDPSAMDMLYELSHMELSKLHFLGWYKAAVQR